jgi:acyl-CoA synthetase (AMP-forming)/AMP-acid ligase II
MELTADDHCLLILPLFHVNAICVSVLAPMLRGAQVSITGRFSPRRFFEDVTRLRPTYFSAVPTIYALLVSKADEFAADFSSLRFAACGAAPISAELLARVESRFGLVVMEGYGLTECTCAATSNPIAGVRKLGTVGPALPGQQVAVVDDLGDFSPRGVAGEVVIKGPNVMQGYLGRPEDTASTIVDGWLRTGDVGWLDDDGYLTLVDRIKDMIIRGGENIYPKEIENALATHVTVLEVAVIGAPDPTYGEVPVAYVVAYPGADVSADELIDHTSGPN